MTTTVSDLKHNFHTGQEGRPAGGVTNGNGINILWQNGLIGPEGPNGAQVEDILDIAIARLEFLNADPFKCRENDRALQNVRIARRWLDVRTELRRRRGVEGTYRP